ncbi:MAG TPA: ABC transporter permease [Candidatus Acidoferrum sp.]|nr:ABC transporter permease [Candidatus Acidoferrum sp.]
MGIAPIDRFVAIPRVIPPTVDAAGKQGRVRRAAITLWETLRLALDSLQAHRLRSFLTLFGVIMAVTTLVVVMSAIAGLNLYVANRVANLGANVFIVDRFGIITSMDEFQKAQKRPLITFDDYTRLRDSMQTAKAVAAIDDRNVQTRSGDIKMENTDVMGASANFADVRNIDVAQGRFITPADDEHRTEVVFIGADLAAKFFPNVDPIGKTIRAETHTYQVIGVAQPFGSAFGQSQDNYMIIPLNTYMKEWHRQSDWLTIFVQSPTAEMMEACEDEARMLMRAWRKVPYQAKDNFAILGSDSIMALWHELTGNLAFVAMALVSVFLVVGGIVIMNIMLASVTERTREIGLRRSLGARKHHIILQFMTESAVLAAVGGLIGILSAYLVVYTVQALFSFPMNTPIGSVVLSLGVSTGVGLFFGIYPATRAAKLDPIEALRAEG